MLSLPQPSLVQRWQTHCCALGHRCCIAERIVRLVNEDNDVRHIAVILYSLGYRGKKLFMISPRNDVAQALESELAACRSNYGHKAALTHLHKTWASTK